MSEPEDNPLEQEFKRSCNTAAEPGRWMFYPTGDTDLEKGIRRGIELVLLTIRDTHGEFSLWPEDDGSYKLSLQIYEDHLTYQEDFTKVIADAITWVKGNDNDIRRLSAYLRAQADEVDKAIGWKPKPRKKATLEEEP